MFLGVMVRDVHCRAFAYMHYERSKICPMDNGQFILILAALQFFVAVTLMCQEEHSDIAHRKETEASLSKTTA